MTERQEEFELTAMPHSRSLLRVARRIASDPAAAEDLVQETLLRAWRNFDRFEKGTNVRAWLFRILFNAFYAQGRKARSSPLVASIEEGRLEAMSRGDARAQPPIVEAAAVSHALQQLSDDHRAVLLLGVVEGFTCREMAEILSLPIGTVMSRISRARQALRERLSPACSDVLHPRADVECAEREVS